MATVAHWLRPKETHSDMPFARPAVLALVLLPLSASVAHAGGHVALRDSPDVTTTLDAGALDVAERTQAQQEGFGTLDPTPPSGITPEQIIQKMGAKETTFDEARRDYTFRQSVTVQTIAEDSNKVDGEYKQVTDITFDTTTGRREEHVVFAPQTTLERVMMSQADFDDIQNRLPFVLTTAELPQYDLVYLGRQKVDELDTYVFSAAPKIIEKNKRYFQGKVWLDQQDLEIVLVNGKNVPDKHKKGDEDLSPPFTTYYEQIDGKYWFPTYTKAEGDLHFSGGNGYMSQTVHLRTVVRYTDYKQFRARSRIIFNGVELPNADQNNSPSQPPNTAPQTTAPPK
jgi:hypothetical protein